MRLSSLSPCDVTYFETKTGRLRACFTTGWTTSADIPILGGKWQAVRDVLLEHVFLCFSDQRKHSQSGASAFLPVTEYGYRNGQLLVTISSGDTSRLSRFVYNLYYGAKQRDPNAQELQDGINQLAAAV